jgi:hypothetical protein
MPVITIPVDIKTKEPRFIHILQSFIPKSGGTSIINYFQGTGCKVSFGNYNNYLAAPDVNILKCPGQHFHYSMLENMFNMENFNYSFSIVRNPFARMKSEYVWAHRDALRAGNAGSFDAFVKFVFDKYPSNPFINHNHIRPQHEFVGPGIKKIFKFEEGLNNIIQALFKEVKISSPAPVDIKKSNAGEDYLPGGLSSSTIEMTPETKGMILKFYEKDFESFSYDV